MLQVAAYCRVSTDKEDQANSFEAQQRYFREYIQRQPDWELQGIYADEGFSGTSTNKRVEFNKMLHAAELGQIDLIVTKEVSRLTRNTVDALQITRELRRRGVGELYLGSIKAQPAPDYNFFMLLTIFYTFIGLAAGIVIDISYGIIDPRIRMGAK